MKGVVFTELFELVEQEFGYDMVDKIIEMSDLESNGIYTAVGTYPHSEIIQLVVNLSKETNIEIEDLLKVFGRYLFNTFLKQYPQFFEKASSTFDFLESIDNYIHVEVLKLYPDATLPRFTTEVGDGTMTMIYTSERSMSALALGLMEKTIEYYGEDYSVKRELLDEEGSTVKFVIE